MSKPAEKGLTPAYGSYKTLMSFVNETKELGHIPLRIDRTSMPKLSGAAAKEMLATLRFLGLITEKSEPTDAFGEFVNGTDDQRRASLEKMLRASYAFLFSTPNFHIDRATGGQVAELFREHGNGISGSTLQRAVSFFLAAAKEAGIKVSPSIKPPKSANTGTRPKREKKVDPLGATGQEGEPPAKPKLAPGTHSFELPLPGKHPVQVIVPDDMDGDDWEMLSSMFVIYVKRWKGYTPPEKDPQT
ncbi:MAG: DUF5343 domain-containing protein [Rhizobium sp.]|nr:DUF5343 domain-containing protein [Rhizobium sp.]